MAMFCTFDYKSINRCAAGRVDDSLTSATYMKKIVCQYFKIQLREVGFYQQVAEVEILTFAISTGLFHRGNCFQSLEIVRTIVCNDLYCYIHFVAILLLLE